MSLEENIKLVREKIAAAARQAGRDPSEITLVAATKVQTSETIRAAIAAGITACGENRVQELTGHLDDDAYEGAQVHFIGHLQTNKVKYIVGRVDLIHSVDSSRLLEAVDKQAAKLGLVQDILQGRLLHGAGGRAGRPGRPGRTRPAPGPHVHPPCGGRPPGGPPLFCENAATFC